MKMFCKRQYLVSILSAFFLTASVWGQTTSFTSTYTGQGILATSCNTSFGITGLIPSGPGPFPVFVYMVGTTETFNNDAAAAAAVSGMASRGFLSASIQYDSAEFGDCSQISGKAKCIFDPASATSAIANLCSMAQADCSKGLVVGGFSQGAVMATLAKNFDSRVRAAWGMGDGVSYAASNLDACMDNGNRSLDSEHLRAVDGQSDEFIGPLESEVRSQLQTLTGFDCGPSATSCLQRNGSGWIIVLNGQSPDPDHCYMRTDGCASSETQDNSEWLTGTAPWELPANLNWLSRFATR